MRSLEATHPMIISWRLEEALKTPGRGGSSTPQLALEMAKRQYDPTSMSLKLFIL